VDIHSWDNFATVLVMIVAFIFCGRAGNMMGWWVAVFLVVWHALMQGWRYLYWRKMDFWTKIFFEDKLFRSTAKDEAFRLAAGLSTKECMVKNHDPCEGVASAPHKAS
jgi:hypothetical protein